MAKNNLAKLRSELKTANRQLLIVSKREDAAIQKDGYLRKRIRDLDNKIRQLTFRESTKQYVGKCFQSGTYKYIRVFDPPIGAANVVCIESNTIYLTCMDGRELSNLKSISEREYLSVVQPILEKLKKLAVQ
jgi:hypothetical protein